MRKTALLLTAVISVVAISSPVFAQGIQKDNNTFSVQVTGSVTYMPDQAIISATISHEAPLALEARTKVAHSSQAIVEVIRSYAIADNDWSAEYYRVAPKRNNLGQDPDTGQYLYEDVFLVTQQISITAPIDVAAQLSDSMLGADDHLRLNNVSYTLNKDEMQKAKEDAKRNAFEALIREANDQIARLNAGGLNIELSGVVTWNVQSYRAQTQSRQLGPSAAGLSADTTPVFHGGEEEVTVTVSATFYHRPVQ